MDLPTDSGPNPTSPEALFDRLLRTDPSVPLLTFYDDSTGERAELSAKSLGNWVAKTHFLLLDALGLSVGEQAAVRLPVHWLAAPILLGCWFAGLGGAQLAGRRRCRWASPTPVRLAERVAADERVRGVAAEHGPAGRPAAGCRGLHQLGPSDAGRLARGAGAGRTGRSRGWTAPAGPSWSPPAWPPPIGWAWPPVAGCCGPAPAPDRRTGSAGCWRRWRSAARWCWCATRIRPDISSGLTAERVTARH